MTTLTLETEPLAAQVHVTHEKLIVDLAKQEQNVSEALIALFSRQTMSFDFESE